MTLDMPINIRKLPLFDKCSFCITVVIGSANSVDKEESSGHFMAYFITAAVFVAVGYVIYHNKQKVGVHNYDIINLFLCSKMLVDPT